MLSTMLVKLVGIVKKHTAGAAAPKFSITSCTSKEIKTLTSRGESAKKCMMLAMDIKREQRQFRGDNISLYLV